jgi:hypothetical protein
MARAAPAQTSFNAGELSPLFDGRADMQKYGNGCSTMSNFVPLPQGPAMRRNGSRYTQPTKDADDQVWLVPFVFSEIDAFQIEFGDGYLRFYTNNGALLTGPVAAWVTLTVYPVGSLVTDSGITYYCRTAHTSGATFAGDAANWYALTDDTYEIPSPYAVEDLTDASTGCFLLVYSQTGDVIFLAGGGQSPKKLTRVGNTNWTITDTSIKGGPFIGVNPDETTTVYASAATGSVTLTASTAIFTTEKIGTLFLLEQKSVDGTKAWEPAKAITTGDERRSDSNVYEALNTKTTGAVKPVHREGARIDGDDGVQWQYLHSGYAVLLITAVAGLTATATVQAGAEVPSQAIGSGNASLRWSFSAWDSVLGWPTHVALQYERLWFLRGAKAWTSVSADLENFAARDGAETLPDSAVTLEMAAGQINSVLWVAPGDQLLVGTRGGVFAIGPLTDSEPFGPGNARAKLQSGVGFRQVAPAQVGDSVVCVQASGRRVREIRFSFSTDSYEANDLTVIADHIARGQITQMAFAQEPHSIVWCCCADGSLIALTMMLEQEVIGWHRHPVGGSGFVESVSVIPAPDGTHDQVWMIVRRTINGATARYVEFLDREWNQDYHELRDATFSDCASTFDGRVGTAGIVLTLDGNGAGTITASTSAFATTDEGDYIVVNPFGGLGVECRFRVIDYLAATEVTALVMDPLPPGFDTAGQTTTNWGWARDRIGGLGYLEGQVVDVLVNGAAHPQRTVTAGAITLEAPTLYAQVGCPAPAELITMRIEAGAMDGTAQGKTKRFTRIVARLYQTLGGLGGLATSDPVDLMERVSGDPMNNPPAPLTGDTDKILWPDGYNSNGRIRLYFDQPLPAAVVALYPQLVTEDSR